MNLEEIRAALQDKRLTVVAQAAGLSPLTVRNIANGKAEAVSSRTLEKLTNYLRPSQD